MLTLIQNGEVYAPEARGVQSVLVVGGRIGFVGAVDAGATPTSTSRARSWTPPAAW